MYTILFLLIVTIIIILLILKNNEYYGYIPTPVVSKYQNYDWYNIFNPNLGFAPAVHFVAPSRRECLQFVNQNFTNPDEAYTKFIECLQNVSSKVWIKNLPIQSPGTGEE
jgi:hypothetical protein